MKSFQNPINGTAQRPNLPKNWAGKQKRGSTLGEVSISIFKNHCLTRPSLGMDHKSFLS
tara:strand:- start:56206 stop:56382 length:177 start_codon:yes stop_codon:yes gene_type:complete